MGRFTLPDGTVLVNVHDEDGECQALGCVLHNPQRGHHINREGWPYNWRGDRGIMERICPHGIGHPDPNSAAYWSRRGMDYMNVHGCDGCCAPRIGPEEEA